jgi:hypothetical protein
MASIGNGDLAIAFMGASVFESGNLLLTLINAPFDREARAALWRVIGFAFGSISRTPKGPDSEALDEMLAHDSEFSDTASIDSSVTPAICGWHGEYFSSRSLRFSYQHVDTTRAMVLLGRRGRADDGGSGARGATSQIPASCSSRGIPTASPRLC